MIKRTQTDRHEHTYTIGKLNLVIEWFNYKRTPLITFYKEG